MTSRSNCWRAIGAALIASSLSASALAQTPPPSPYLEEEVRHLIGIQNRMRVSLEQLPNYTCRMEIRRAHLGAEAWEKVSKQTAKQRGRSARPVRETRIELDGVDVPLDTADIVALEVAIIGGKELYAFPDSSRFEDRPLASMIGHGTVATGSFAGHARNIFVNGGARTAYVGEEVIEGQPVRRYDYQVALFRSGYSVTNQGQTAKVPYFGSFWAGTDSDELVRMTVRADDVPIHVGIDHFTTQVDYQTLRIDSQPFIVPLRSRFSMMLSTGVESISETEYSDCRSFVGSSTVSFDASEPDTVYVERAEEVRQIEVPEGLHLPIRLTSPISSDSARVGTLVEAELDRDVEIGPGLIAPQGSLLRGRLLQFEFVDSEAPHYVLGIRFHELTFDSGKKRADLALTLERLAETTGIRKDAPMSVIRTEVARSAGNVPGVTRTTVETYQTQELPGVGVFYVRGRNFEIKPGLRMTWRVAAGSSAR